MRANANRVTLPTGAGCSPDPRQVANENRRRRGRAGFAAFGLAWVPATSQGRGVLRPGASGGGPSSAAWQRQAEHGRRVGQHPPRGRDQQGHPGLRQGTALHRWGKAKSDGYDQFMQTNGDYVGNCLPFGMSGRSTARIPCKSSTTTITW